MKDRKFGIGVLGSGGLTVPQHIELIKQVGWDAFFTGWDPARVDAWAEAGAKNGLIYTSIHAPHSREHYIWNGDEKGEALTLDFIRCTEDCARIGVPVMVIHTINGFDPKSPAAPTEIGFERYGRIIEAGNKHGVKLAFENTEREVFLHAVMERFAGEPCLGFCFDSGHEHCYANSDVLTRYGHLLCHTHLDDNLGVTGDTITWYDDSHLPLGDGSVDFGRVMDRLEAIGYSGVLTCELTMRDKPERNTHNAYKEMPAADFYALALDRVRRMASRTLK